MEQITWYQVTVAALAAFGGVTGLVAFGKFAVSLWDRRRKARLADAAKTLNDAVELKRLAAESAHIDDEAIKDALWKIIQERKDEITELKVRILELEHSHSLSRPTVLKIYEAVRKIRQQVDIVSHFVDDCEGLELTDQKALADEVTILRGRIGELEQILP
jgi:hypothetical protein